MLSVSVIHVRNATSTLQPSHDAELSFAAGLRLQYASVPDFARGSLGREHLLSVLLGATSTVASGPSID